MNIDNIIEKKINNKKWNEEEIDFVVRAYTFDKLEEDKMIEFINLIYNKGLSFKETLYLTNSMINTGNLIKFDNLNRVVVDKHSTGGVGDKVTLIVSPIVAANGLAVAKMSGKSLGLTGGTIDKLESINGYKVNLEKEDFIKQVSDIGVSIISQTDKIAVADKKIYALRDRIGAVDSIPLIASSIMSKKIASGAKVIIIDLKVGNGAFMKDVKSAKVLAKTMIKIGKAWDKKVVVILSDMNSPLGLCVGNSLEVKETINFFEGKREKRLEKLCITIASHMISLGLDINIRKANQMVLDSLKDGSAKKTFNEWIYKQGGDINSLKDDAKVLQVKCSSTGYINSINANKIATICNLLGSGRNNVRTEVDYAVGVEIVKPIGSYVEKGEVIANVYFNKEIENINKLVNEAFNVESINNSKKDIIIGVIK